MSLPGDLRAHLADLLTSGAIGAVLGSAPGRGARAVARWVEDPDALDTLDLSPLAAPDLLTHLTRREIRPRDPQRPPVAVLARGCETLTLNQLLAERGLPRERLHVVGLDHCPGVIDPARLRRRLPALRTFPEVRVDGDAFVLDGTRVPRAEVELDRCGRCPTRRPLLHDQTVALGPPQPGSAAPPEPAEAAADTRDRWDAAFARCIRCHACRNVCPLCYCSDCVLERLRPVWVGRPVEPSENAGYQLQRVLDLAGRCTECGECARACPERLPLMELLRAANTSLETAFGHRAGQDPEARHVLSVFDPADPDHAVTGGR